MDHVCGGHWLHGLVVFDWCRIDQLNFFAMGGQWWMY